MRGRHRSVSDSNHVVQRKCGVEIGDEQFSDNDVVRVDVHLRVCWVGVVDGPSNLGRTRPIEFNCGRRGDV